MPLASLRGVFVGAAFMYLMDPDRGRVRRSRLVNGLTHARHAQQRLFGKAARDASHRAQGLVERARHPVASHVDDEVLAARVRSRLGREVSHPSAIEVVAQDGAITLRGPILEAELAAAKRCAEHVAGVLRVTSQLEPHATADRVPGLQGQRVVFRNGTWTPAARAAALIGGSVLASYGGFVRRGVAGAAYAIAGSSLALRGGLDMPLSRIIGFLRGSEPIAVHKAITVRAPVEDVFDLWSRVENFPRFMEHVRHVERIDDKRSRWTVDGPGGVPIRFETELTHTEPGREIAWRTVPGQAVEHSGRVRFERAFEGARIEVDMTYRPPGGIVGHAIAHLLRSDPKARMDQDLVRMKTLLENGHARVHGQAVTADDLIH
ncbi:MAG: cyclase [Deltaproteobacteria bacterium]|nr:cyclase [Deltaproteobacteria bacterium]